MKLEYALARSLYFDLDEVIKIKGTIDRIIKFLKSENMRILVCFYFY